MLTLQDIVSRYDSVAEDDLYHPLYDLNVNGEIDREDLITAINTLNIERPVGLNFDNEGNLIAVFYLRFPETLEATPENPLANLTIDPADDYPPTSFDTLTADDWHNHQNTWFTGIGNSNSELVYFEEDVPFEAIVSRLQQIDFQWSVERETICYGVV